MKRFLCVLLTVSLLLSGCGFFGKKIQNPVRFYYLREEYKYHGEEGIIGFEERESSSAQSSLSYLLALYRMGPGEESLRSPLPPNIRILVEAQEPGSVTLRLSDSAATMREIDYTLACACLALTCMELTNAETVTINCADRSVTINQENLILLDSNTTAPTEETQ